MRWALLILLGVSELASSSPAKESSSSPSPPKSHQNCSLDFDFQAPIVPVYAECVLMHKRFAHQGAHVGSGGIVSGDFDEDGVVEFVITEAHGEGLWRVLTYQNSQLKELYLSQPMPGRIVGLEVISWAGKSAFLFLSTTGEIRVHDAATRELLGRWETNIEELGHFEEIGGFDFVNDATDGPLVILTTYSDVHAYSLEQRVVVWRLSDTFGEQTGVFTDVAIGNLDADPDLELAVANSDGTYIVTLADRQLEWSYSNPAGYGNAEQLAIGNFDADSTLELAGAGWQNVYIFDGDSKLLRTFEQTPWETEFEVGALSLADIDGDGQHELLLGHRISPYLWVLDASLTTTKEFTSPHRRGLSPAEVVDLDGDGLLELIGGAGIDGFYIADLASGATRHLSHWELKVYAAVALADLDRDGRVELIVASLGKYDQKTVGVARVLQPPALDLVWDTAAYQRDGRIGTFSVMQYDTDPALELVLMSSRRNAYGDWEMAVHDGRTGQLEHLIAGSDRRLRIHPPNGLTPIVYEQQPALLFGFTGRLVVVNYAGEVLWTSDNVGSLYLRDGWARDVDGDGNEELFAVAGGGTAIFHPPLAAPSVTYDDVATDGVLADIVFDGQPDLLLTASGRPVSIRDPSTMAWKGQLYTKHWAQSMELVATPYGDMWLVMAGQNMLSYADLVTGETKIIAKVPGLDFGSKLAVARTDWGLQVAVDSNSSAHYFEVGLPSAELVFRSGAEGYERAPPL